MLGGKVRQTAGSVALQLASHQTGAGPCCTFKVWMQMLVVVGIGVGVGVDKRSVSPHVSAV